MEPKFIKGNQVRVIATGQLLEVKHYKLNPAMITNAFFGVKNDLPTHTKEVVCWGYIDGNFKDATHHEDELELVVD